MNVGISIPPFLNPLTTSYAAALLANIAIRAGHTVKVDPGYMTVAENALRAGMPWEVWKRFMNDPFLGDLAILPLMRDWEVRYAEDRNALAASWSSEESQPLILEGVTSWLTASLEQLADVDVLAISATHYALAPAIVLAQHFRAKKPNTYIVLGGYFGSLGAAANLMEQHGECIDCLVYGEAESSWQRVLHEQPHGIVRGLPGPLSTDPVTQSPVMDFAKTRPWILKRLTASLEFSRGCYWDKCDFCNFNAGYGGGFRERDPRILLEEIDRFVEQGIDRFQLLDTSVSVRLGKYLEKNRVRRDIQMFCEIRADYRRRDLEALARLGSLTVQIGVESLSDSHLLTMQKNATVSDNVRSLRACRDLGIPVTWGVFVAHPNETREQLEEIIDAMKLLHHLPPPKYVTYCEVRPGSILWRSEVELGSSVFMFGHRMFDCYLKPDPLFAEFLPTKRIDSKPIHTDLIERIQTEVWRWTSAYELGNAERTVYLDSWEYRVTDLEGRQCSILSDKLLAALRRGQHLEVIVLEGALACEAIASGVAILASDSRAVVIADLVGTA